MGQNLVPLVNIKIAGKWMFIPLKMVLIGIDPYPYMVIRSDTVGWVDLQRIPTSLIRGTTLCSGHGVSHLYLVSKNWTDWTWLKQATFLGQLGLWDRRNPGLANHVFIIYVYWVYWLVVSTPLKNMSQWEGLSHILWKIKNVPNHQPVYIASVTVTKCEICSVIQWKHRPNSTPFCRFRVSVINMFKKMVVLSCSKVVIIAYPFFTRRHPTLLKKTKTRSTFEIGPTVQRV